MSVTSASNKSGVLFKSSDLIMVDTGNWLDYAAREECNSAQLKSISTKVILDFQHLSPEKKLRRRVQPQSCIFANIAISTGRSRNISKQKPKLFNFKIIKHASFLTSNVGQTRVRSVRHVCNLAQLTELHLH